MELLDFGVIFRGPERAILYLCRSGEACKKVLF